MTVAVAFRFPGGRFHATPWDRHVNEADVEWPPSPWRFVRALTANWHRKLDPDHHPEETLSDLIERLASTPPIYSLPPATHAHTRHYMPVRQGKKERKVLIFDAFVRVPRDAELVMAWPGLSLDRQTPDLLRQLLRVMDYFGRSESWVEARLLDHWDGEPNCVPSEHSINPETGELRQPVRLPVPQPPEAYGRWRQATLADLGLDRKDLKVRERRLRATLPPGLLGALRLQTSAVRRAGWSRPPGVEFVTYQRPYDCFEPDRRIRVSGRDRDRESVTTVRLTLAGKPLPRIEDAVRIGELIRSAAIHKADDPDSPEPVPPALSGHGMPEDNRHDHAFYLPEDSDGDGFVDHVVVHADAGLDRHALHALDCIDRLWDGSRGEWRVILEGFGGLTAFDHHPYLAPSRVWESVTPYLHPWFRKKNFTVQDQIHRECHERGLPEPELERMPTIAVKGRRRRPIHFHRFRSKRGLTQPDRRGSFWRLSFPQPITGPLALGFACHFGLGLFRGKGDVSNPR